MQLVRLINKSLRFWQVRYLIILFFFNIALLFLEQGSNSYVPIFFLFLTIPVYIHSSFWCLITLSKYLKKHHNLFYKKNKGYNKYKTVYFVFVPIFGFVESIKNLKDKKVLDLAIDYKISLNSFFCSFLITLLMILFVVL